jgi:para-aminobenzoate synthetase component I
MKIIRVFDQTAERMREQMNYLGSKRIPFLFILDFDLKRPVILPLADVDPDEIMFDFNGVTNAPGTPAEAGAEFSLKTFPVSFERYQEKFDAVVRHLHEGHSYLVNLTQPTRIALNRSLREVYRLGRARYKMFYRGQFVFFSPEIFVQIRDGQISTYPMKGTLNAGIPDAEEKLLADDKENAEHLTVVDLLRNDLGIVATDIAVERYKYIDRIKTHRHELLQMSSKITGSLGRHWNETLGDMLVNLLPAGSITGAPKKRTVEIIREVEDYDRGYYTGVCGLFSGSTLDSCVMIRFIEQNDDEIVFKSGGGITVYSSARSEYEEMLEKVYVPIS